MNKTGIEYLDYTWNPISMLCSPASSGCSNCWHLRMAKRMSANPMLGTRRRAAYAGGPPRLNIHELYEPSRRRKPARIGVQFMGDLFHDDVTANIIVDVFRVMLEAPWHTFLVLTKRPERMMRMLRYSSAPYGDRPAPNVWLGVSVEDQEAADIRIPLLLQTPATLRWVSVEPMLGWVDLRAKDDWLTRTCCRYGGRDCDGPGCNGTRIDWVVAGAETGPRKRPMDARWSMVLAMQCKAAGVPFYGKVDSQGDPMGPREIPS